MLGIPHILNIRVSLKFVQCLALFVTATGPPNPQRAKIDLLCETFNEIVNNFKSHVYSLGAFEGQVIPHIWRKCDICVAKLGKSLMIFRTDSLCKI